MTIDAAIKPRRLFRPVLLVVAAVLAITLAAVTARAALSAPSGPRYLTVSRSVDVLQSAFGGFAERDLREPQVVVAPTSAATWALSDEVNMKNRAWNPRTGRPWARGDARQMWPGDMGGFTDPVTGTVYINAQVAVASHVPHEVLHANAAPEFLLRVGVAINEGVTEQLALDAMAASRLQVEKDPAYAAERELTSAIVKLTGRDRMLRAYFNGGAHLAEFVASIGPETLQRARNTAAGGNVAGAIGIVETAAATAAAR